MRPGRRLTALAALLALLAGAAQAFYLPGVAPQDFAKVGAPPWGPGARQPAPGRRIWRSRASLHASGAPT